MTKPRTLQGKQALLAKKREREADRRTKAQAAEQDREARKQQRDQIERKLAEVPEVEGDLDEPSMKGDSLQPFDDSLPKRAWIVITLVGFLGCGPFSGVVAGAVARYGLQALILALRGTAATYANTTPPVIRWPSVAPVLLSSIVGATAFFPAPGLSFLSFLVLPFAGLPAAILFLVSLYFSRLVLIQIWAPIEDSFRRRRVAYERAALQKQWEFADAKCKEVGV